MSEAVSARDDLLVRVPMTYEQFLALDDDGPPGEYYGGMYVAPPGGPTRRHQTTIRRIESALRASLPPAADVVSGWPWSPARRREELIPDVIVVPATDEDVRFTGIPYLVVEVLATNRRDDLVAKVTRYAAWGAGDYWVLDPRDHAVLTFEAADGVFVPTQQHTNGRAVLTYRAGSTRVEVPVDVDDLLG